MNATRTIYQDPTDQPPSRCHVHDGECAQVRSWQGDHPYLEPLCAPPLFQLIMEGRSLADLAPFTRGPACWSVSGEIES
ncbi:MAG: hypothetical protein E6R03_00800 [Hyphomicrobiaceae bacterium]|nr:MAG: hypothetical protein E6R03_00800 [Hyphomicrobiaceae bacterium]